MQLCLQFIIAMVKLQFLLRHPRADPGVDPDLQDALSELGITVTGAGRASVSAHMEDTRFEQLFGALPHSGAGFAPLSMPELAIPPSLAGAITQITIAPHHRATNH
jgi:hypothetical protein